MFTISCYSFHPLVKRFLTLWRYAQVVSDCLTFLLSCLCCQCGALMPLSNASSADEKHSVEAFKIMSEAMIDAGRTSGVPFRPQHLVIDFTPQGGDGDETGQRCQKFWETLHARPDLAGMLVSPGNDAEVGLKEVGAAPYHRPSSPASELPAIHAIRSLAERGVVDAAFAATSSKIKR